MKVQFKKGKQRKFFNLVLKKTASPYLSELINRGLDINYQNLKNYYSERRLMPYSVFSALCKLTDINEKNVDFVLTDDNWGQSKGGKISKKNGPARN